AGHSDDENWLRRTAEFEAELKRSGYNLDNNDDTNFTSAPIHIEPLANDSADFLSVPVPIESSTSLNDHGWAPKQTIIIIAVKMIKWKNNSNRRNYNNNYSRDNNNIRDSAISFFIYKTLIEPFYLSPLRKIPGPPSESILLGNFPTVAADEMVPTIINVTNKLNDMLNDVIGNQDEKLIVNINSYISKATLDIIGLVGFQYEFNSLSSENELATAYEALFNVKLTFKNFMLMVISNKLKWFRSLPFEENIKMTKSVKVIERISLQLIRERQKQAQLKKLEGKDLLSLLININQDLPPEEKIFFIYKSLIGPFYLSPLCKIPGPPSESILLGNFPTVAADEMVPTIINVTNKLNDMLNDVIGNQDEKLIVNINSYISKATLDIIGLVGFQYEFNSLSSENELAAAYDEIFNPKITFMNFLLMVISDKFKWIRYLPFEANIKLINSVKGAIFLFKGAGHSDDENWLRRTAEFEAELKRSGYNLDNNDDTNFTSAPIHIEPLANDSADFLSVPVPIESSTSLNDHGWAPKQTIIIIAVKMIKWKNNSNRRNYNNNYSRDNNNIRDSAISFFIYKTLIEPFYLSPLRKIPGPPSESILLGNFPTVAADEMVPTIINVTNKLNNILNDLIGDQDEKQIININSYISNAALDIIGLVGFQYEFNSLSSENELATAYEELFNPKLTFKNFLLMAISDKFKWIRSLPFEANLRLINAVKVTEKISLHLIKEKQKQAQLKKLEGKDLLSLLINSNQDLPPEEKISELELKHQ
ncbi:12954_t:CDS:10, partial [Entrophospora sp. SA101]